MRRISALLLVLSLSACWAERETPPPAAQPTAGSPAFILAVGPMNDLRLRAIDENGLNVPLPPESMRIRISNITTAPGCPVVISASPATIDFSHDGLYVLDGQRFWKALPETQAWSPSIAPDCTVRYTRVWSSEVGRTFDLTQVDDLSDPSTQRLLIPGFRGLKGPLAGGFPPHLGPTHSILARNGDLIFAINGSRRPFPRIVRTDPEGVVSWVHQVEGSICIWSKGSRGQVIADFRELLDPKNGTLIARLPHPIHDTLEDGTGLALTETGDELLIVDGPRFDHVRRRIPLEIPAVIATFAP